MLQLDSTNGSNDLCYFFSRSSRPIFRSRCQTSTSQPSANWRAALRASASVSASIGDAIISIHQVSPIRRHGVLPSRRGMELEEGPCRNRMEPAHLQSQAERKLFQGY